MDSHRRRIILVVIASVVLSLAWNFVDANPTLLVYDALLSVTSSTKQRLHKFKGKTVWVTGASSGIGAELVCLLVEAEAKHSKRYLVFPLESFVPPKDQKTLTPLAIHSSSFSLEQSLREQYFCPHAAKIN